MITPLGEILSGKEKIRPADLPELIVAAREKQVPLGRYLGDSGAVSEEDVYRGLAEQFNMPFHRDLETVFDQKSLSSFTSEFIVQTPFLPLVRRGDAIAVAVTDPLDIDTIARIQLVSGMPVETHLTVPAELERMRATVLKSESLLRQSAGRLLSEYEQQLHQDETSLTIEEIRRRTESEPVVRMVELIFNEALAQRASDIHIEPSEHSALIRFRVDGMLKQHMEVDRWMYLPVTSRIKILADLDIAEKRTPQDGRIRHAHGADLYDFRVSILPTHFGEKTVVRILKYDLSLLNLVNTGMDEPDRRTLLSHIDKPQGMIIVTGPTGSGKSSTLFACLNHIRKKAINITTIENPIEYKLEGINQVQVNEKAGMTFPAALRSILRQDPDVILVGEIRDTETAHIAIQAAQTGHLVLSTLHTNDAVSAITRLRDLEIPGYMISSSLLAIVAQRLVRTLCPRCRTRATVDETLRLRWKGMLGNLKIPHCWQGTGCDACGKSGFRGRTGIYELVVMTEEVRAHIADNAADMTLRRLLRAGGMRTLIEAGVAKIEAGETTPEELLRVVTVEDQTVEI